MAISNTLRTNRYIKINESGLSDQLEETPENRAAFRQAFFETDGKYHDGPLRGNPLKQWWTKTRSRGK